MAFPLQLLGFALAYGAGAELSYLLLQKAGNFSAFWPPAGIYLGMLLATPRRRWGAVVLAAAVPNLLSDVGLHGQTFGQGLGFALVNLGAPLVAAALLARLCRPALSFARMSHVMIWCLVVTFLSTPLGAVGGAAIIVSTRGDAFLQKWFLWWVGDLLGVLALTPLAYAMFSARVWPRHQRVLEAATLLLSLGAATVFIFRWADLHALPPAVLFLFLMWAALRFSAGMVAAATTLLAVISLWLSGAGFGLFSFQLQPPMRALMAQVLVATGALLFYILAAAMAERRAAETELQHSNLRLEEQVKTRTAELTAANAQLRESEERYRTVVNSQSEMLCRFRRDGTILFVNAAYAQARGTTIEALLGGNFWDFIAAEDQPAVRNMLDRLTPEAPEIHIENRFKTTAGVRWTLWINRALTFDTAGRVVEAQASGLDITERKEAEVKLREQQELIARQFDEIQAVYETAPVGLAYIDRDLRFIRLNERLAEIHGFPLAETVGRTLREILPASLADQLEPLYHRILATGETLLNVEVTGETKAQPGVERVWIVNYYALKDTDGAIIGVNAVVQEITERKRGEQRLAALAESLTEQRELLAIALRTARMGAYEWRVRENTIWWSPEAYELFGVDAASFTPSTESFSALIHPDDRAELWRKTEESIAQKGIFQHEYRIIRPDGATRWLYNRSHVGLSANGEVERVVGMVVDITARKQAEQELAAQKRLHQSITDNATTALFIMDERQQCVFMNPAAEQLTGYCFVETQGRALHDVVHHTHPDGTPYPLSECPIDQAFPTQNQMQGEEVFVHKDGHFYNVAFTASPMLNDDGKPISTVIEVQDITERKHRELNAAFLADLQKEFIPRTTVEEITHIAAERIVQHFDLTHCLLVEIDETSETLVVFHDERTADAPDLRGTYRLADFHTAEERAALAAGQAVVIHDVRDGARPESAAAGFEALGIRALVTAPFVSQGGWRFALSAQCHTPHVWRDDERVLLTELAERIYLRLERARAEAALRESEHRFRTMADSTPVMIWVMNANGEIEFVNRAYQDFFGVTEAQILGPNGWQPLVHPDDYAAYVQTFLDTLHWHTPFVGECRVRHASGAWHWILSHGAPRFSASGAFLGQVGSSFDITARKELELEREQVLVREQQARRLAEEANRAKDDWLAMVTHELRSPLNAMLGFARLLDMRRTQLTPELAKFADLVRRNGERQNELINDLLDTARLATGKLQLEPGPVKLAEIVREALDTVQASVQAKELQLWLEIDEDLGVITGDATRLQQVVWNLLTNAVKFTPPGGSIVLGLHREPEQLVLTVSDTGRGIAPDFLQQVFDRFSQADMTRSRRYGGLGLGLALVKQIVELHGGTITAASEGEGKGATFTVRLPATRKDPPRQEAKTLPPRAETPAQSAHVGLPPPSLNGVEVLLVEDDPDLRELMLTLLRDEGALVRSADSAAVAWPWLTAATRPHLVICDIAMPEEDGYSLLARLRQWEKAHSVKALPAVALTALGSQRDRLQALRVGFQMHIAKPVDIEELLFVLQSLLARNHTNGLGVSE